MKKLLTVLMLSLMFFGTFTFAKGRSGGFSKSSGGSKYKSTPKSKPKATPKKSFGSSSRTTPKPKTVDKSVPRKLTPTQQKSMAQAKKNGTSFKTKKEATSSFTSNKAMQTKYKSSYTAKPATRPTHIPSTYSSGGSTHTVIYNQSHGGYGHMGPSGSWIAYNAMRDVAMVSILMNQNNYMHTNHMVQQPLVVAQQPHSNGGVWLFLIAVLLITFIIAIVIGLSNSDD